jgi:hypothetical protein
MYITCTLAHRLRSWYVTKCYMYKHKRASKHGFVRMSELCPRSAKCLLNIHVFHKIQDYFQFHNYESGRVDGFSRSYPPPHRHARTHARTHAHTHIYISVPFLKEYTFFRGFFTYSRKHLISKILKYFSRGMIEKNGLS